MNMKMNITNEYNFCDTIDALFSFEYQDHYYIVFDDDGELSCRRITWTFWRGFKILRTSIGDNVITFANNLLNRAKSNPKFFAMNGEHYYLVKDNETGESRVKKSKRNPLALPALKMLPKCCKWLIAMIFALIYAWMYTNTKGLMWAYSLFPSVDRDILITGMYILQIIGTTLLFAFKKVDRSLCDFYINALIPLNFITLFGAMKSNTTIRTLIYIGLAVAGLFYVFPKIRRAIVSKKSIGRRQNLKLVFSRVYTSLLVCVAIGVIASNFFGVTGYTYRSGYGSTFSDIEAVSERYKQATDNINENVWATLSDKEKIDTLQSICDYECINRFGCETVTVQTGYPRSVCVLGAYNHITRTITISSEHLKEDHVSEVLDTLLHETRHVWQNTIVDMYSDIKSEIDDKYQNLSLFQQAKEFQYSFDTYQSGVSDYDAYYDQAVESDSRAWASSCVMYDYEHYIYIDRSIEEVDTEQTSD